MNNNSLQLQQLTTLRIGVYCYDVPKYYGTAKILEDDIFFTMLQLFEHLQVLDLSYTTYGASCMLSLGATRKPQLR
jgi:hypothetical protein